MAASDKDVKVDWSGHALPVFAFEAGETLPAAVNKWRRSAAQVTTAATSSQWLMQIMSLKRPMGSLGVCVYVCMYIYG